MLRFETLHWKCKTCWFREVHHVFCFSFPVSCEKTTFAKLSGIEALNRTGTTHNSGLIRYLIQLQRGIRYFCLLWIQNLKGETSHLTLYRCNCVTMKQKNERTEHWIVNHRSPCSEKLAAGFRCKQLLFPKQRIARYVRALKLVSQSIYNLVLMHVWN